MAKLPFIDIDNLGGPFNAFPLGQANFSQWNALREELPNNSLRDYEFEVDVDISLLWAVFQGNTAPTSYSQAVAVKDFTLELQQFYTGPR